MAEIGSEPIEQLGMAGDCAARSEIINGLNDAATEHHLPCAIDCDSRKQRMTRSNKPSSEAKSIARSIRRQRRQDRGCVGGDRVAMLVVSSAFQDVGWLG